MSCESKHQWIFWNIITRVADKARSTVEVRHNSLPFRKTLNLFNAYDKCNDFEPMQIDTDILYTILSDATPESFV